MTRKATGSIYKRGETWWIAFRWEGARYFESTGTGDRRLAQSILADRKRNGPAAPKAAPQTVGAYLDTWVARRERDGVRGVRDEQRAIDVHIKPVVGEVLLEALTRPQVRDLVANLQAAVSERTGERYSPRYVIGVYSVLRVALGDAVKDGLLAATPCTLSTRRGELPRKRDKDPTWRSRAVYTRDEIEVLLSSEEIPLDRRALYALQALAGLRGSEATGRRWRDYDTEAKPLGRLMVATQADGADDERETKTGDVREVPVHPVLAAILAEWRLSGFPVLFGRRAEPDDPIVPSRQTPKDRPDLGGRLFRSGSASFERLVEDLDRIKLRRVPSARHAMRATFLSLLEVDGANLSIARRTTHAPPRDVVGGYLRPSWQALCTEIGKLRIERRKLATVHVLPLAVGDAANGDRNGYVPGSSRVRAAFSRAESMGVAGLERPATPGFRGRSEDLTPISHGPDGPENAGSGAGAVHSVTHVTDPVALAIAKLRALGCHEEADALERAPR